MWKKLPEAQFSSYIGLVESHLPDEHAEIPSRRAQMRLIVAERDTTESQKGAAGDNKPSVRLGLETVKGKI